MSMKITTLLTTKKNPAPEEIVLLDELTRRGISQGWYFDLINAKNAPWMILSLGEDANLFEVLLYGFKIPVAVLSRPAAFTDNLNTLKELNDYLTLGQVPKVGDLLPYAAFVEVDGESLWVCDLLTKESEKANKSALEMNEYFREVVAVQSIPKKVVELAAPDVAEPEKLEAIDPEKINTAPAEEPKAQEQKQIVPAKVEEGFDSDYINDPPMPGKKARTPGIGRDFFSEYEGFTIQSQMNAMRKEYANEEMWQAMERVVAHFIGQAPVLTADDSKIAYDAQLKFSFLDLLYGNPVETVKAFTAAKNIDRSAKYPTLKEFRTLDTISSRLAQSHDSYGTVMRVGPHPRKGEMVIYLNFFSDEHPVLFTSGKFMPVLQARCNEFNTKEVTAFITEHCKERLGEVPDTLWLTHQLNDTDLDLIADIAYEKDKREPGTFAISFNTQGGRIFDDTKAKVQRFTLDPLASILAQGLPFIYYIKNVYHYDAYFRKYWNEKKRDQLAKRQEDLTDYVSDLVDTSEDFYGCFKLRRDEGVYCMVPIDFDVENLMNENSFQDLVDLYHHQLRSTIMIELVEQGLFVGQRFMTSIMPNDSHAIMVVNDLLMADMNVEAYDAQGYFNIGALTGPVCISMRPKITPNDRKVGVEEFYRHRYDQDMGDNRALIDLRMFANGKKHAKLLYVGSGNWERKLNGSGQSDTRNVIFYDYEAIESKKSSKTGRMEHTREEMGDNDQWKHAMKQTDKVLENGSRVDLVGVIVPFRAAPLFFERYGAHVKAVLPAPYPAEASFYALTTRNVHKSPATLKHVYLMVQMKQAALFYSNAVYKFGYNGIKKILAKKLSIFTSSEFGAMSYAWYTKMKARHVWTLESERVGTALWRVKDDQSRLLRNDTNAVKKASVNQALLARKQNSFIKRNK